MQKSGLTLKLDSEGYDEDYFQKQKAKPVNPFNQLSDAASSSHESYKVSGGVFDN